MAQWITFLWNKGFINLTRLLLLRGKTKSLALEESGLMASWQAIRQMKML